MENKNNKRNWLFGWNNIKWLVKELVKVYKDKAHGDYSYFSKKRIESGIAFIILQWGMIYFLIEKHADMTASDLAIWTGIEMIIAGYTTYQIEKEKKEDHSKKN